MACFRKLFLIIEQVNLLTELTLIFESAFGVKSGNEFQATYMMSTPAVKLDQFSQQWTSIQPTLDHIAGI